MSLLSRYKKPSLRCSSRSRFHPHPHILSMPPLLLSTTPSRSALSPPSPPPLSPPPTAFLRDSQPTHTAEMTLKPSSSSTSLRSDSEQPSQLAETNAESLQLRGGGWCCCPCFGVSWIQAFI
ncbi:hypothetical protein BCR35DRAFT_120771 [Leucosporidium creatinivorum]|uniref:Uncharacterized protein n=1 Tax=Leucosporidium creatinivorum TaxID=106004 RepID=A0A1Y2EZ51_9BASI|nr:hypothetical protein BCR35DRAFT_120771 [Leucosporidium creatinivorum]